jgi:DNA-binding PadR family transcriptional regulator
MRGSPLKGVLLGLVAELEQPTHAYVLASMMARRLGPAWQVDRKGVYQMLSQLQSAKLIASEPAPSPTKRGTIDVYFPTERTEAALELWMETYASKSPVREELQAKVAVSRARDVPSLLRGLDAYEHECFDMLKATTEAEVATTTSWSGLAMALARIAADEHLQAELRWVMTAREAIQEFMAQPRR